MRAIGKLRLECSHCHHEACLDGAMLERRLDQPLTIDAVPLLKFFCGQCKSRNLRIFDDGGRLLIDAAAITPCRNCGMPIPLPRLAAMPGTRICAACASEYEQRPQDPPYPHPPPGQQKCPRCGSSTIVRQNENTGDYFIGCTRFPKCHWTTPMRD